MTAYYNEIDPYAAQWLCNLILDGQIAPGHVDTRSIEDVTANDLKGYTQCHFFAGIGVWSRALRLAGWPDDRAVWTGSCPCQPFSAAGKGAGFADERHLWPAFEWLISQHAPSVVFGEQVASPDALKWLDVVFADLESSDYACAPEDLCAAGIGAPHIRQRLYWVADSTRAGRREERADAGGLAAGDREKGRATGLESGSMPSGLGNTGNPRREACNSFALRDEERSEQPAQSGTSVELGHARGDGLRICWRPEQSVTHESNYWSLCDWIACRDGKYRPVEPGTFPLASGITNRVGRLRAYGNAIVAPLAAEFIKAYLKT